MTVMQSVRITGGNTAATANLALETAADLYRNGGYPSFATSGVYPGSDGLRLDVDRHAAMCFAMSYIPLLETPEIIIPKVLRNYLATLCQKQKKQKGEIFVFPLLLLLVTGSFNHMLQSF